jgi:hypothetical protein
MMMYEAVFNITFTTQSHAWLIFDNFHHRISIAHTLDKSSYSQYQADQSKRDDKGCKKVQTHPKKHIQKFLKRGNQAYHFLF